MPIILISLPLLGAQRSWRALLRALTRLYHRPAFHVVVAKTELRRISDDPHAHDRRTANGRSLRQAMGGLDKHRLGRGGDGAPAAALALDHALAVTTGQHRSCPRLPHVGHRAGR